MLPTELIEKVKAAKFDNPILTKYQDIIVECMNNRVILPLEDPYLYVLELCGVKNLLSPEARANVVQYIEEKSAIEDKIRQNINDIKQDSKI